MLLKISIHHQNQSLYHGPKPIHYSNAVYAIFGLQEG